MPIAQLRPPPPQAVGVFPSVLAEAGPRKRPVPSAWQRRNPDPGFFASASFAWNDSQVLQNLVQSFPGQGAGQAPAYLPMQKSRKMASSTSSALTSPVIDPSAVAAAIMSTATISGGIRESAELRAFLSAPRARERASR